MIDLYEQVGSAEFSIPQNEIEKNKIALILAKGFFAEDEETRKKFEDVCLKLESKMGMQLGTDIKSVIGLVNSLASRNITDIVSLNHFKTIDDVDDRNYLKKLKKLQMLQISQRKNRMNIEK